MSRRLWVIVLAVVCVQPSWGRQAGAVRIENEALIVACRADGREFTIVSKRPRRAFVIRGSFPHGRGQPRGRSISSSTWGAGETIEVESISGQVDSLTLFPGLPFLAVKHRFANDTQAETTIDRYRPVQVMLDTIEPAGEFRALGTAGLTGVDAASNPGSYSFLAIADPESRAGVVTGWLTHERGSGVLFSDIRDGRVVVDARLDYGRLLIEPGKEVVSETLLVGCFDDARLGLEAYADAVARHYRIQLPPEPTVYCTWYHAGASNERDILTSGAFAKEHLAPYGFSVVQIDDKWQAGQKLEGPRKDFNRHRADGPYPSGMKQTAEKLKRLGMTPGIWFMPFAGTWNDPFFADKQHLFAEKGGEPFVVKWGGTCFDMTNPLAQAYVRAVASRIAHDWGYEYFKLDGLWTGMAAKICYINTGYQEDGLGESVLHDPHKTHVEAYRDGLKLVREAAGDAVFLLGCNVAQNMRTLGASFGLLDAMRIGPDNGRNWKSMCRGPFSGSNLYFLHGRVWYNDPDPIYVRDSVPLEHARALTSWVALTGQLNASSTDYTKLSPERLHLLQRSMPAHDLKPRPVDLFEQRIPRIWVLTDERRRPRRDVVGLFNWEEKDEGRTECPLTRLGLADGTEYVGFDCWADSFVAPFQGTLKRALPPASCQILAVRPVAAHPQLVSTSRHITQGVIDVLEERWNQGERSLQGVSRVVGRDPYELRIAAMGPTGPWRAGTAAVSKEDTQAGVTIRLQRQQGWRVRVQIDSPVNRQVRWSIGFAAAGAG